MYDPLKRAADGGPLDKTRMPQHTVPCIRVRMIDTKNRGSGIFKIAERDFDPKVHTRVEDEEPVPAAASKRERLDDEVEVSSHTEDELLTMSAAKLKKLPEFSHIDEPSTDKTELVAQILAAREALTKKD